MKARYRLGAGLQYSAGGFSDLVDTAMAAKHSRRAIAAGLCFGAALFSMMAVRHYYTWYMPRSAETNSGRTIAIEVNFGRTVYVDPIEQKLLYGTYIAVALATIAAVVVYFLEPKK